MGETGWDDELACKLARSLHRKVDGQIEVDDLIQVARIAAWQCDQPRYAATQIHHALIDHCRAQLGRTFRPAALELPQSDDGELLLGGVDDRQVETVERVGELLAGATENERQVIELRGQGLTRNEIADQLGIHPSSVTTRFRRALDRGGRDRRPLRPRELEVLQLAADGLTNKAIGERLHIAEETVKSHFKHIYRAQGLVPAAGVLPRTLSVADGLRHGLVV